MEKLKLHTPNITNKNILSIKNLFPHCVTETTDENGILKYAIDFEQLQQELSDSIIDGSQERYRLDWPGKRQALITANTPINKTLRPAPHESVAFDTTKNLFIEGDNLDVLKLLQETYLGKVKMIYIDPPYNTGKDFVYRDNFTQNTDEFMLDTNQKDDCGNRLIANLDTNGRFHSDWLSMIYPRLKLARNLLTDDGVIFISIDDNEQANLKKLCDEVFGEENFVGDAIRKTKSTTNDNKTGFNIQHENTLVYAKVKSNLVFQGEEKTFENYKNPDNDPKGTWISDNPSARTGSNFEIKNPYTGKIDLPPENRQWLFSEKKFLEHVETGKIKFRETHKPDERGFIFKRYKDEVRSDFALVDSLFGTDNIVN